MTWTETSSPTRRAAAAPASVAAFTAPTSPRTITVTYPAPMYSLPARTTFAVLTIASAASMEPISPFVSTRPRASDISVSFACLAGVLNGVSVPSGKLGLRRARGRRLTYCSSWNNCITICASHDTTSSRCTVCQRVISPLRLRSSHHFCFSFRLPQEGPGHAAGRDPERDVLEGTDGDWQSRQGHVPFSGGRQRKVRRRLLGVRSRPESPGRAVVERRSS